MLKSAIFPVLVGDTQSSSLHMGKEGGRAMGGECSQKCQWPVEKLRIPFFLVNDNHNGSSSRVTKQTFIPDAPLTTHTNTKHWKGDIWERKKRGETLMVSNKQQFFCFKCWYEFIKAMPEAINDGRRNVHHLFCSGIAKMLFLDQNRNVIIKKKVSPQFRGHLIF